MPGSGTRTFLEPDDYEASLRQTQIELVSTCCGGFEARLTWAELHSMQLLRLHAQACRLAETKPKMLTHPEVARAIEQGLIQALVTCLIAAKVQEDGVANRRHARIMIRFEEVLAENISQPLHMAKLSELI